MREIKKRYVYHYKPEKLSISDSFSGFIGFIKLNNLMINYITNLKIKTR